MENYSTRDLITETVNKLFVYTDERQWEKLQTGVFTPTVHFDMSSIGGEKSELSSKEICDRWQKGFEGIDSVNHLAENYLITINEDKATVFAYATATHYKKSAVNGNTRELIGTYDLHLMFTSKGWRLDAFKYNLKYTTGNTNLT